ncbi:type-4 uracil-DNA glycosylase [Candidatus Acidianus copahuensis]|uniref:Type-4 uracil-DNA glycosylase n=1 Tax=Candidatus Acidianus copahuensis TaxID=1160895 RepID=A0A031LMG0_9CREN|nr:type-4 uracil-DNA glycosylase [Candidatus Acidianus copahuensis]EZQ02088.1 DNA polymerase [Candidatus Acidianus copahuensis]NON63557.1 uracil-DNA glycosylase [Acidianus sp. RZ1]
MEIDDIAREVESCRKCKLSISRIRAVPGEGNPRARVMLIGEAPGANEDKEGRPFVGAAGKFLTQLLASIGLSRDMVFITNLVKCRPPENRDPEKDEISACSQYLERQILSIKPEIIVTLGRHSTTYMMAKLGISPKTINSVRGKFYFISSYNCYVFPTFHPAAALYNPSLRKELEEDFKKLGERINSKKVTLDTFMVGNGSGNKGKEGSGDSIK